MVILFRAFSRGHGAAAMRLAKSSILSIADRMRRQFETWHVVRFYICNRIHIPARRIKRAGHVICDVSTPLHFQRGKNRLHKDCSPLTKFKTVIDCIEQEIGILPSYSVDVDAADQVGSKPKAHGRFMVWKSYSKSQYLSEVIWMNNDNMARINLEEANEVSHDILRD